MKKALRLLLSINVALVAAAVLAALAAVFGALNGYAGGYVATWAVNSIVSADVGAVLGAIEGLLVGLGASIVLLIVVMLVFMIIGALTGGAVGVPVYDSAGGLLGWFGGPGPDLSGLGCGLVLFGSIPAALIAGAVAGVSLNHGTPLLEKEVANIAALVLGGVGILAGLIVGVQSGIAAFEAEGVWPGAIAGLIDGGVAGYWLFGGRWLEILVLALVGAVIGGVVSRITQR